MFFKRTLLKLFIGFDNILGKYLDGKILGGKYSSTALNDHFMGYIQQCIEYAKNNSDNWEDCYIKRQMEHMKTNQDMTDGKLAGDLFALFLTAFHVTLGTYIFIICICRLMMCGIILHNITGEIETVLYFAAKNLSEQDIVYNELKEYFKNNPNGFAVKDVNKLHYFRAFIYETMRINGVSPKSNGRYISTKKLKIAGYNIPKGSIVDININGIHNNAKYFGNDCDKFNMYRWLNNNNEFKMNPAFVVFGLGPRNCVGQTLAMREVFSVLAPLLYKYRFTKPDNIKNYDVSDNWFQPNIPELPLIVSLRK